MGLCWNCPNIKLLKVDLDTLALLGLFSSPNFLVCADGSVCRVAHLELLFSANSAHSADWFSMAVSTHLAPAGAVWGQFSILGFWGALSRDEDH